MTATPVRAPERRSTRAELAEQVVKLRWWMHLLNEDLKRGAFRIPVHLAFGHEAIAVAVSSSMMEDDQLVLTHRNVAYNLIRAGDLAPVRDEFHGMASGLAEGRFGSMNLINPSRGVSYASSILGNNLAVATGIALAKSVVDTTGAVTVLTGDGAMEEGQFYESLIFAKTHALRMIIVIENNDQSMSSTIAERRVAIATERLCAAVGIPSSYLSGSDVFSYVEHMAALREDVARDAGPRCVEVRLAAMYQHAGPTPGWATDPKRIEIANGLIVAQDDIDPVFVLRERLGPAEFDELEAHVRAGWPS